MHNHTIDWYLQLHLTSDSTIAKRRWDTAISLAKKLTRTRIIELLRLFLFVPSDSGFIKQFTSDVIDIDKEFPISNNTNELRMMAGLVIVTTFQGSNANANALALGLRAASFPAGRARPMQSAIATEAEQFLSKKANELRPNDFTKNVIANVTQKLVTQGKVLSEAVAAGDELKKTAEFSTYRDAVLHTISESHRELARRIARLAEESALLWWVIAEYSDALNKPVTNLIPEDYALPAATEAAQRTIHLPPPPSIGPLLVRALKGCNESEKKPKLIDYLKGTAIDWRVAYVKSIRIAECRDLAPISAALEKTEELGSGATALKALEKLCPGLDNKLSVAPEQAAQQFYNEIVFLRALEAIA